MADGKGGSILQSVGLALAPQTMLAAQQFPLIKAENAQKLDSLSAVKQLISGMNGAAPDQTLPAMGGAPAQSLPGLKLSTQTVPNIDGSPNPAPTGAQSFQQSPPADLLARAAPRQFLDYAVKRLTNIPSLTMAKEGEAPIVFNPFAKDGNYLSAPPIPGLTNQSSKSGDDTSAAPWSSYGANSVPGKQVTVKNMQTGAVQSADPFAFAAFKRATPASPWVPSSDVPGQTGEDSKYQALVAAGMSPQTARLIAGGGVTSGTSSITGAPTATPTSALLPPPPRQASTSDIPLPPGRSSLPPIPAPGASIPPGSAANPVNLEKLYEARYGGKVPEGKTVTQNQDGTLGLTNQQGFEKPMTTEQRQGVGYIKTMQQAEGDMANVMTQMQADAEKAAGRKLPPLPPPIADWAGWYNNAEVKGIGLPNTFKDKYFQRYESAADRYTAASLGQMSPRSVNPERLAQERENYFGKFGDKPEEITAKNAARAGSLNARMQALFAQMPSDVSMEPEAATTTQEAAAKNWSTLSGQGSPNAAIVPTPKSAAERDALPKGTKYAAPDGSIRTRQ